MCVTARKLHGALSALGIYIYPYAGSWGHSQYLVPVPDTQSSWKVHIHTSIIDANPNSGMKNQDIRLKIRTKVEDKIAYRSHV